MILACPKTLPKMSMTPDSYHFIFCPFLSHCELSSLRGLNITRAALFTPDVFFIAGIRSGRCLVIMRVFPLFRKEGSPCRKRWVLEGRQGECPSSHPLNNAQLILNTLLPSHFQASWNPRILLHDRNPFCNPWIITHNAEHMTCKAFQRPLSTPALTFSSRCLESTGLTIHLRTSHVLRA